MYKLHCVMANTLEHCENYDNIADAVHDSVAMWLEGADNPRPMVLHDVIESRIAVTFVPLGTNSDQLLVVYNVAGIVQRWTDLVYHRDPVTGLIDRTTAKCDGKEEVLYHRI